jgi:hypothetical protein
MEILGQRQVSAGFAAQAASMLRTRWKNCAYLFLIAFFLFQRAHAGTITGQFQTATGGTINNGTLSFTLSQPAVLSGTASLITQASSCYTSTVGNIVGLPDPLSLPVVTTNTSSGTLAAGTYYTKITYYGAGGETVASAETSTVLTGTGTLIVNAPILQPAGATGYKVYIGTSSGGETLQATITGFTQYQQSGPLANGSALPSSNTTVCTLSFSDQLIPTGTYYSVNLVNKNGSLIDGFPQVWCTYGGQSGTINVSNGAPTGNCGSNGVFYPTPIFANPFNNAPQSISGPLSVLSLSAGSFGNVVYCDGIRYATLNAAVAALGSSGSLVVPAPGSQCPLSGNLTIPIGMGVEWRAGAVTNIPTATTLTINGPISAPGMQIFSYTGTGTIVLGGTNGVVHTAWFPGADFCGQVNSAMLALQSGGGAAKGGFFDARDYTNSQTCGSNPFSGVTMPFQLNLSYVSVSLTNELAQWQHSGGNQFVVGYAGANPAMVLASASWPAPATVTNVVVTSNVAAVTLTTVLPRAPIAGSMWCIFGTTDPGVEGCVYVLASPAPTTTTFSYSITVSNRTVTGGTASAPMVAIGNSISGQLEAVRYNGVNLNGNGQVGVDFANVAGQEGSGIENSILTNFTIRGIDIGGPDRTAGSGNHYYRNLHVLFNAGASNVEGIACNLIGGSARINISDVTIVPNSGGTGDAAIWNRHCNISVSAIHVEGYANAVKLMGAVGTSVLTGTQITVNTSNVVNTITSDAAGNEITVTAVGQGSGSTITNSFTGTTLTGALLFYFSNTNTPKQEFYLLDKANGLITGTAQAIPEGSAPSGAANLDICYGDSTAHAVKCNYNNAGFYQQTQTLASGTATMTTAAIAAGACGTTVTVSASGVATIDSIAWAFNAAPAANPAQLVVSAWPTSGNVNFQYCNPTAGSITPNAATLNWRVVR